MSSNVRTDNGKLCAYCLEPIEYQKLNKHLSAGACRNERCVYHKKIIIKGPKYRHEMEIE